jgi:hypothetical protein
MRLFLIALLLFVTPLSAQWGGDSRFYRTDPIPREGLVVDLDFSQFSYSGGVYTIRNMANAAAPAYMYGGLNFNSVGSDSSGLSRDIHTGQVVLATDGSAGDSAGTKPTSGLLRDSVGDFELTAQYAPLSLTQGIVSAMSPFVALRYDTSGTSLIGNYSVALGQAKDTLVLGTMSPSNSYTGVNIPGVFLSTTRFYYFSVKRKGSAVIVYLDNDSLGAVTKEAIRRSNRIVLGYRYVSSSYHIKGSYGIVKFHSRALTSTERTVLYNNTLHDTHEKKKFSRW